MILTFSEIIDIIIMTLVVGFIFEDVFRRFKPRKEYEPLEAYKSFDMESFKFSCAVTAPAIILHELGHKFVALSFGMEATLHAAYFFLALGVLLKLMKTGFIFFVPAYVAMSKGTAMQSSITALAGPAVNAVLWLASSIILKKNLVNKKHIPFVYLTKQINMFLFIFNMLPIPGFDGFHFFRNLIVTFL